MWNPTFSGLAMIGASSANDSGYTGSGVKVSVVDSGIAIGHSELRGHQYWSGAAGEGRRAVESLLDLYF